MEIVNGIVLNKFTHAQSNEPIVNTIDSFIKGNYLSDV